MNKFLTLIILMVLAIVISSKAVTIVNDGTEWLKVAYKNPESGEDHRIRWRARLASRLGLLETATAICFETDDTYEVNAGAKAFGIQFWCGITDCKHNYQLGAIWFGSVAKDSAEVTWTGAGDDVSHTNKGVGQVNGGKRPDYLYGMSNDEFEESNLPAEGDEVYLKCFTNFSGSYHETNLNTDMQLTESDGDSDWTAHEVHLNEPASSV
jgi:hypothetical protein